MVLTITEAELASCSLLLIKTRGLSQKTRSLMRPSRVTVWAFPRQPNGSALDSFLHLNSAGASYNLPTGFEQTPSVQRVLNYFSTWILFLAGLVSALARLV